jgi:hypothetical protein
VSSLKTVRLLGLGGHGGELQVEGITSETAAEGKNPGPAHDYRRKEPERPPAPCQEPDPSLQEAVPPRYPVALPEPSLHEAEPPR